MCNSDPIIPHHINSRDLEVEPIYHHDAHLFGPDDIGYPSSRTRAYTAFILHPIVTKTEDISFKDLFYRKPMTTAKEYFDAFETKPVTQEDWANKFNTTNHKALEDYMCLAAKKDFVDDEGRWKVDLAMVKLEQ